MASGNHPLFGLVIEHQRLGLFLWQGNKSMFQHWHICEQFETYNLTLFNPTRISQIVRTFLNRYVNQSCKTIISLDGACLRETLSASAVHNAAAPSELLSSHQLSEAHWYAVSIPYALRAQYHLLALAASLDVMQITTTTLAYCARLTDEHKQLPETAYVSLGSLKDALCSLYASDTDQPAYLPGLYALMRYSL